MVKYQEEIGENGTRHIQGYANTDQVRLSQMKAWLPRAHFVVLKSKEHIENTKSYVWKKDETAVEDSQVEIVFRSAAANKPLTMADALTRMAAFAWSDGKVTARVTPTDLHKGMKLKEVYEEEYWDIVKQILMDDENVVGLYTQPQYMRAWVNTRSVWILKNQLDSQTRVSVISPDGEISPVTV